MRPSGRKGIPAFGKSPSRTSDSVLTERTTKPLKMSMW